MTNPLSFLAPLANNTYYKDNSQNKATSNYGITQVQFNDIEKNTAIRLLAQSKARNEKNQSALSVMLQDYSEMCQFDPKKDSCTHIPKSEMKDYTFIEKLTAKVKGEKLDNIYRNDELQNRTIGGITRQGIYQQELIAIEEEWVNSGYTYDEDLKKGASQAEIYFKDVSEKEVRAGLGIGLQYAQSDDDLYQAAINLASADIASIEKACSLTSEGKNTRLDGCLNSTELDSPNRYRDSSNAQKALWDLDLNGDRLLQSEEYAAYILAVDSNQDGILTSKEVAWANENFDEIEKKLKSEWSEQNL